MESTGHYTNKYYLGLSLTTTVLLVIAFAAFVTGWCGCQARRR